VVAFLLSATCVKSSRNSDRDTVPMFVSSWLDRVSSHLKLDTDDSQPVIEMELRKIEQIIPRTTRVFMGFNFVANI